MRTLSKVLATLFLFLSCALAANPQWSSRAPMPQPYHFLFQDPVVIDGPRVRRFPRTGLDI
jgi:hypothetical protein